MKKANRFRSLILVSTLLGAIVAGCASTPAATPPSTPSAPAATPAPAAPPQKIKLKVADSFSLTHYISAVGTQGWMKRVTELTNGQVEFEHYPAEQLGKIGDMISLAKTGAVDVAYTPPTLLSGDFPLAGVLTLPGLVPSAKKGTEIYQTLINQPGPLHDEYASKGLRPLFLWLLPFYEIFSPANPIAKLEDMKGLKTRIVGGVQQQAAEALLAVPVQIASPELYTASERKTVDALMFPYTSLKGYKLDEVLKHATLGANVTAIVTGYSITEKTWKTLPKNVQDAITQATKETINRVLKHEETEMGKAVEDFKKAGGTVYTLAPAEQARWKKALDPVTANWLKDMEGRKLPAKQVVEMVQNELKK